MSARVNTNVDTLRRTLGAADFFSLSAVDFEAGSFFASFSVPDGPAGFNVSNTDYDTWFKIIAAATDEKATRSKLAGPCHRCAFEALL